MSLDRCRAAMTAAAGRPLTREEQRMVDRRTASILRQINANTNQSVDPFTGLLSQIQNEQDELRAIKLLQKRNALINARARRQLNEYLKGTWADDPGSGLRAFVGGLQTQRFGARNSVAALVSNQRHARVGAFVSSLEDKELLEALQSGQFDLELRQIAHAADAGENLSRFNETAVELFRLVRAHTTSARLDINKAGGFTKHRNGWLAPQSHDPLRIAKGGRDKAFKARSAEAQAKWIADIERLSDPEQSLAGVLPGDRQRVLQSMFIQFATGRHLSFGTDASPHVTGVGMANLAKRSAREREIVFKSPEAEQEYFELYGRGETIYESIVDYLDRSGRDIAIMRRLGPNAQENLNKVFKQWEEDLSQEGVAGKDKLDKLRKEWDFINKTMFPVISGASNVTAHIEVAAANEAARNIQRMADLGGMLLSSFNDVGNAAARIAFTGGRGPSDYFKATQQVAEEIFSNIGKGTSKDARTLAVENGVAIELLHRGTAADWTDGETPGKIARATQLAFKYFGANWWMNRVRTASTVAHTVRYGMHTDVSYGALPAGMRRAFSEYGITQDDWDIIRSSAKLSDYQGNAALTGQNILDMPDEAWTGHPLVREAAARQNASAQTINRAIYDARQRAADNYSTLVSDAADAATTSPTALTRSIISAGGPRGELFGEMTRHFFLYRSYSLAYMDRHLGQILHGYHPDRVGSAAAIARMFTNPGQGQLQAAAGFIASQLFYGMVINAAADFIGQGKFRPIPDSPEDAATVLFAAFTRSGMIGLYTDLFAQHIAERTDFTDYVAALAGPSAGRAADAGELALKTVTLNWDESESRDLWRLAYQSIPGRSLFYTRLLTDNLIYHNIAEALRPGHKADLEDFNREDLGYEYVIPPTEPFAALEE